MQLRRWCVSMTFEPMRFFWTLRNAERFYWSRATHDGALERMGLYRWRGGKWVKQVQRIADLGRMKIWIDEK